MLNSVDFKLFVCLTPLLRLNNLELRLLCLKELFALIKGVLIILSIFSCLIYVFYIINIYHYMAFFISYPLSALGHDISPRADRLKG